MDSFFPVDQNTNGFKRARTIDNQFESLEPWEKIKEKLEETLPEDEFAQWIEPLKARSDGEREMIIVVPDMSFYQRFLDCYLDKFDFCRSSLGIDELFRFEVADDAHPVTGDGANLDEDEYLGAKNPPVVNNSLSTPISRALSSHSQLNPEYRFDNFVNGPSNQFAHASCLAVADEPGRTYNPLFLYGSTGLGKTHLLHAVGNSALSQKKTSSVTYISSERFMNEMIYCLRFNKMWDFRNKYRNCDILLVDDIQIISGKERTQEEFFHTFNALYEAKKQIIVTSDVFPQDIPDIEERLRNRFQWGLIADIQPPDEEHRVAILMNKADKQGIALTDDVAQYIATQAKGSVRVLEGALRRIAAHAALQGRPVDLQLATEVLQNLFGETQKQLSIEVIQRVVAEHFKIRVADLKSKKRQRAISVPRQLAMFLARIRTASSYPEIGSFFGGKDHSTVMHAVKKIELDKKTDLELKSVLEAIDRRLDQLC